VAQRLFSASQPTECRIGLLRALRLARAAHAIRNTNEMMKTHFGWWALFTSLLFVPSWFLPVLQVFPDSPNISPAGVLSAHYGPCVAGPVILAVLRFAFISLLCTAIIGWFAQRVFQTYRHNHAHTNDA
jgi:hypothetical protein